MKLLATTAMDLSCRSTVFLRRVWPRCATRWMSFSDSTRPCDQSVLQLHQPGVSEHVELSRHHRRFRSAHIERSGAGGGDGVRGVAAFLDLARDPEIVSLVSDIIGEDVILWGAHVFCKPAGEGYETPWHQVRDGASLIERRDICHSEQCRHIPFVANNLALSCLVLLDAVSLMSH
jgi:hypothetical protein